MPPVSMPRQAKIGVFGGLEMLHDDVGERFLVARAEKIDHALADIDADHARDGTRVYAPNAQKPRRPARARRSPYRR